MSPPPALDLANVTFIRAGRTILDDISLRVEAGEQWALLGPNGAGKSSLLGICSATTFPSRGTASILGSVMGRVDLRALRRSIGLVEPRHPTQSDLRVADLVLTGATGTTEWVPHWIPTEAERERAAKYLAATGLPDDGDLRWHTMSQGERGRALIARALMAEPPLMLLDEPSTGLDLVGREIMLRTIDDLPLTSPGITTLVVTHYFEELPRGTTHAALLRAGRLVAAGPVEQVLVDATVSACFDHPIAVRRSRDGRWHASAR
ncbi:MAG: ATP-binding cassette domain-containing protein [Aeromicrobium sp.]|uniref:ABC transporter ATP-binding protein n=1 Tax=Aeromicrobium sp. TaxID=1871063 RepID=UPI0039E3745C